MYYSDKIEDADNERWIKNNDFVYLNGDTGTGKSTYIFEKLIPHILWNTHKHIFILSNRKLLTKQHRKAAKTLDINYEFYEMNGYFVSERYSIMTYQAFHDIYIKKRNIEIDLDCEVFSGDDFVFILDECHYFLSDFWNKTTEQTLNTILKFKATTFFMSATGDNVIDFVNLISDKKITEQNTVSIFQDYSNITLKSIKDNTKKPQGNC
ncbi:DEAD/DEAH box helicase family protein [Ruminococcus sp. HUN007]|uniref:DEAD/DEAH box helicase family protein n=1 Tax=Ruminococcus sp. HUN007 TaxID=1514668 RepID=UPI0005D1E4B7|nr:DEAD/DEAH box helicase family protein [Ruminococcus sp. HUN007]